MNKEKEIEKLKRLIKCGYLDIDSSIIEAIKYILQENEELHQENEELHKEINQRIKLKIENEKLVDTEFIHKGKIKEKIKEFNVPILDVLDKLPIMPRTIERGCGAKDGIIYVLQELLEGE